MPPRPVRSERLEVEHEVVERDHLVDTSRLKRRQKEKQKNAFSSFQLSAEMSCEREFWSRNASLARAVVDASSDRLDEWLAASSSTRDSLPLVEESAEKVLNSARRVIKEASESRSIDCLCVATHCLRAVTSSTKLTSKAKHREAAVKLLYHAIVTAETKHNAKETDSLTQERAFSYGLAAFDSLGTLLLRQSCAGASRQKSVRFSPIPSSGDKKSTDENSRPIFCVPIEVNEESLDREGIASSLLCTIALTAVLSACHLLVGALRRRRYLSFGDSQPQNEFCIVSFVLSSRVRLVSILSHLLRTVFPSWILFSASQEGADSDKAIKDIVSSYRRAHALLWVASDSVEDPLDRLSLRQQSIASLLCWTDGNLTEPRESVCSLLLSKGHWEIACSMAKKAVKEFQQSIDTKQPFHSESLVRFHSIVGKMLDSLALSAGSEAPAVYIDYCVYRATDGYRDYNYLPCYVCGSSCIFNKSPCVFAHADCAQNRDAAFLSLYFFALCVLDALQQAPHASSQVLTSERVERVKKIFRSVVLENPVNATPSSYEISRRMVQHLWTLKLHVAVFDATSAPTLSNVNILAFGADLLVTCIGPLAAMCLTYSKEERAPQLWDVLFESISRGIAAYEAIALRGDASTKTKDNFHQRSDSAASFLAESILMNNMIRVSDGYRVLERGAKLISVVARRRQESQSDALLLLLRSVQLFDALQSNPTQGPLDYRISARWLWLASAYSSRGKSIEESLARAVALNFDSFERSLKQEVEVPETLVMRYLCSRTNGIISLGPTTKVATLSDARRKTLVNQLVSSMISMPAFSVCHAHSQKEHQQTVNGSSIVVELLLGSMNESVDASNRQSEQSMPPLTPSSVLQVILSSTAPRQIIGKNEQLEKAVILVEILESFGRSLQTDLSSDIEERAIEAFRAAVSLGEMHLRQICNSEMESRALRSIFYVVASACLVSGLRQLDFDCWNLDRRSGLRMQPKSAYLIKYSCELAQKASDLVAEPHNGFDDMNLLAEVLQKAISVYQFQLDTIRGVEVTPVCSESMIASLGRMIKPLNKSVASSDIRDISRWCFVALLSRLCDSFSADGEKLQALQIAFWNCYAVSQSRESSPWFHATTLALQSLDSYVGDQDPHVIIHEDAGIAEVEFKANLLRLRIESTLDVPELLDLDHRIRHLLATIESYADEACSPLLVWARGTALIAMCELSQKLRRFEDAISFANSCYKACRRLLYDAGGSTSGATPIDEVAGATLLTRASMRQIDCLRSISYCYFKIGDRLKAAAYAEKALSLACFSNECPLLQLSMADFIAQSRSLPCPTSYEMQCRRLLFVNKALSTPWDLLNNHFQDKWQLCNNPSTTTSLLSCGVNQELERLFDLEAVSSLLAEGGLLSQQTQLTALLSELDSTYEEFLDRPRVAALTFCNEDTPRNIAPIMRTKLKLARARSYLFQVPSSVHEKDAASACEDVIRSSPNCESRAYALYYLGLIELQRARRNGDLTRLWTGHSNLDVSDTGEVEDDESHLIKARGHFTALLPFLGPASDHLTRAALRSLSLTLGPHSKDTSEFIHTSVGASGRLSIARRIENGVTLTSQSQTSDESDVVSIMRGLDFGFADTDRGEKVKELLTRLESLLPPEWRVVACALCPTGELLISSFFLDDLGDLKAVTACVFPEMENGIDSTLSAYDSIMAPLDRVVHESQEQLQSYIADDVLPREWWKKRTDLDQRLKDQISHVERAWFGSEAAQMAVLGVNKLDENQHLNVNLSSRFDAAMHSFTAEERDDEQASVDSCVSGACVFLVLDENLQRFPFEGMSFFRGLAVCRQPSLPFLVAKLSELAGTKAIEYQPALIDFDRVSYILDPESNLPGMAKRLQPFLDELEKNLEVTWDRMVGEIPPKAFLERSVAEPEGLLLYFGHGNGQNYFSKSDIERLVGSSESCAKERPVRSSIILMGCSSGRLESVNRKGTKLLDQQLPMYHEPEGLALSYLAFGAPCVVGNLWDVTDRDIDAFAMNMLERFTSGGGCASVAECVAHARSACKLRYMIGCAPVCYGVPVFRKKKK